MCLLVFTLVFLFATSDAHSNPKVRTRLGIIEGSYEESYYGRTYSAFVGVPYAEPPLGNLRYSDPKPIRPWSGILHANTSYTCAQFRFGVVAGQEDCLYANIYVPRKKFNKIDHLDVLVNVHGGGYMLGSGTGSAGAAKLMDEDVIVVTFNYRLGALGFLSFSDDIIPGNFGIKDQVLLLKWVKENIDSFGGNAKSITISGFSAGASSVTLHYLSPSSRGLFHRGYAMSGSVLNPWAFKYRPLKNAKILTEHLGCYNTSTSIVLSCLRQKDVFEIIDAVKSFYVDVAGISPFAPVIEPQTDSAFLTEDPKILLQGSIVDIPLMFTTSRDEGLMTAGSWYNRVDEINERYKEYFPYFFEYQDLDEDTIEETTHNLKEVYYENRNITQANFMKHANLMSRRLFHFGIQTFASFKAKNKSDVFYALMNYKGKNSFMKSIVGDSYTDLGIGHGDDLPFYFDEFPRLNKEDEEMMNLLIDNLVHYMKTGKPKIRNWVPVRGNVIFDYLSINGPNDTEMMSMDFDQEAKDMRNLFY